MRRRSLERASARQVRDQLTDADGQPITFAIPGEPTVEERRRYALAVQQATTPPPLTLEEQAAATWRAQRELDLLMDLERQRQEGEHRRSISTP